MKRIALSGIATVLLLPVLVISAATGGTGFSQPSPDALADIPADRLALYQQAGLAYDLPWELLAAIGKVECDHGRHPDPSCHKRGAVNAAGAGGPMQFLAATWDAHGIDADADGTADRWNPADAIYGAANYLRASGAPQDIPAAVYAYNHSSDYVDQVLTWAERYQATALNTVSDSSLLAETILTNPRIHLRPEAKADVRAGRIDPRVLTALLWIAQAYELDGVGPFISGHALYVRGTNQISNHAFGRAVDIGAVNGAAVSRENQAARSLALALSTLPASLRPDEIGSPFPKLSSLAGFFSDADHQDHIHLGWSR